MLPGNKRKAQKAATRARILDEARVSLEVLGYEEMNLRSVAAAAGVSTGAVLSHFRDKQDLLHTALFEDLERTWELARISKTSRSFEQELAHIAAAFFAYYAKRPAVSRTLLRESLFADSPWRERFAAQTAEIQRHVATLHRSARASSAAEATLFATNFSAFYTHVLLAWLEHGHPDPLILFKKLLRPLLVKR